MYGEKNLTYMLSNQNTTDLLRIDEQVEINTDGIVYHVRGVLRKLYKRMDKTKVCRSVYWPNVNI